MLTPTVTVLMPTYNRADMIEETISSLLAQSYPIHQFVIVNDGSTDNTLAVLEKYSPKIKIITVKNGGKSKALNAGMQECTGEYIWICDDDDIADKDGLHNMVEALQGNNPSDIVFGKYEEFADTPEGRVYNAPWYSPRENETSYKTWFLEAMFTNQFAMLVKRDLYQKIGGFNEELLRSQDWDMTLRITRNASISYVPKVIFYYRKHAGVRGTGAKRITHATVNDAHFWMDNKIIARFWSEYAVAEFTPSYAKDYAPDQKLRSAHILRALIGIRRGSWKNAVSDIHTAAQASNAPLTDADQQLMTLFLQEDIVFRVLSSDKAATSLFGDCARAGSAQREMIELIFSPLTWKTKAAIKAKDRKAILLLLSLFVRIYGVIGGAQRLLSKIRKGICWRVSHYFHTYRWKFQSEYRPLFYVPVAEMNYKFRGQAPRHALPQDLIISLTSYPPRFPTLALTLKSLLRQNVSPDKVILWIAEGDMAQLPADVLALKADPVFEIRSCEDLGSYKKMIPAIEQFPESFIVTADDDLCYPRDWLDGLASEWDGNEKTIVAHRGHLIKLLSDKQPAPYTEWEVEVDRERIEKEAKANLFFATSGAGMFFPPHSLANVATDRDIFMDICRNADDIWFFWMAWLNGSKIVKTRFKLSLITWHRSQAVGLLHENVAESGNDKKIQNMIGKFGWPVKV